MKPSLGQALAFGGSSVSCSNQMSKDDKNKAKKLEEKADDINRMSRILKRRSDEQSAKKKPIRKREDSTAQAAARIVGETTEGR
jgi:hypothetical protein